jgi:hypothetical protein
MSNQELINTGYQNPSCKNYLIYKIEKILTSVVDIYTEQDIVSSNALDSLEINGDKVTVNILLNYPA